MQEKESRVVEILAAAVPIRTLLWGKIAGASVLAIGQTVVLAVGRRRSRCWSAATGTR